MSTTRSRFDADRAERWIAELERDPQWTNLCGAIEAAVHLAIADLRDQTPDMRDWVGEQARRILTRDSGLDELMYGGGRCGRAFGALAAAIAVMAYFPGGVFAFGRRWCA